MKPKQITFSKKASEALNRMKGRIGLNWNALSRIGFCISLNDPVLPDFKDPKHAGDITIDRKTLLGNEEELYFGLLRQYCVDRGISEEFYNDYFKAHMDRGVVLLSKRISNLKDLTQLITTVVS